MNGYVPWDFRVVGLGNFPPPNKPIKIGDILGTAEGVEWRAELSSTGILLSDGRVIAPPPCPVEIVNGFTGTGIDSEGNLYETFTVFRDDTLHFKCEKLTPTQSTQPTFLQRLRRLVYGPLHGTAD